MKWYLRCEACVCMHLEKVTGEVLGEEDVRSVLVVKMREMTIGILRHADALAMADICKDVPAACCISDIVLFLL
jgi:hypothetical protein